MRKFLDCDENKKKREIEKHSPIMNWRKRGDN